MSEITILVTGGAGFIGSNFLCKYVKEHKNIHFVNLDKLTYAGNLQNLKEIEESSNYTFVEGDICDSKLIKSLFEKYQFNHVFHLAAESHVDNSIKEPGKFIQTNIVGSFNLINTAFNLWMESPFKYYEKFENSKFIHISTDEVYGSLGKEGSFTENSPYKPSSPYSSSKAGSDLLIKSYFITYGLNVIVTNCSNNYGPKQHKEKLIPTIVRNALSGNPIPIYGKGENIRDWLHVDDHCEALWSVFEKGIPGQEYNIGGGTEVTNIEICNIICSYLDKVKSNSDPYSDQITFVQDRYGHDFRYSIDCSRINNELGWSASRDFKKGLEDTVDWFLDN